MLFGLVGMTDGALRRPVTPPLPDCTLYVLYLRAGVTGRGNAPTCVHVFGQCAAHVYFVLFNQVLCSSSISRSRLGQRSFVAMSASLQSYAVGIDLGTSTSGISYVNRRRPEQTTCETFTDREKTDTSILVNDKMEVIEFGHKAYESYVQHLDREQVDSGAGLGLDSKAGETLHYFEQFKMW
jgi:hypothetical protein